MSHTFQLFLDSSTEHQSMRDFIHNALPDILASVGNGKSQLNVIRVGSGAGEIDLEMISQLCLKHLGVLVDNEVVEPNSEQFHNYTGKLQALVAHDQCVADFIHMVQVCVLGLDLIFYSNIVGQKVSLSFFITGDSGWVNLGKTFRSQLCNTEISQCLTTADIKSLLDMRRVPYKSYELQSHMDITECFTEGDETGGLMLDFLTEVLDFSKTASPELRQGVMRLTNTIQYDSVLAGSKCLGMITMGYSLSRAQNLYLKIKNKTIKRILHWRIHLC
uniref:Histamine N-methyltransferase n=1 Tax=Periophthalmus magnuspinnatus TaxID=409849 RepID=A0A3B4AKX3_9GOBI